MTTAGYQPGTNYTEQGATRTVIEGDLDIASGGEIDIESGAALKRAGVDITTALDTLLLTCATATCAAPTAEAAEARTVSIQLKDHLGADLAHRCAVEVYVSTDANGDTPGDGDATITLTAGTDGALISADETGATFISEADGDLDVVLTDGAAASATVYLQVCLPNGKRVSSAAIAFAA